MTTKLDLYNGALMKIKQRTVASLASTDPARYALDTIYDRVVLFMLEQGDWNFAQRTVELEPSDDITPSFGYTNAFDVPEDFVKLISISTSERLWPGMSAGQFAFESVSGGYTWQADCTMLFVSYVSSGSDYGANLAGWTATYAEAVEYELATRIAPSVTNMTAAEYEGLDKLTKRALRNAKTKDCLNQAGMETPPGRLTLSRRAYGQSVRWLYR